jgi:hypothetical protein
VIPDSDISNVDENNNNTPSKSMDHITMFRNCVLMINLEQSLSHQMAQISTFAKTQLESRQITRGPTQSITLAIIGDTTPVEIDVTPVLVPEKIVDKRMNEELGHYEYLVKFQNLSTLQCMAFFNQCPKP